MAYDKIVDSAALDTQLTSIADAIRAKTGGSDSLVFPDGFSQAIAAIEAGGGSGGAKITTGTLVPLAETFEIVHGLGVIPDYFIFYIEETRTETSRTTVHTYATPETTIKTPVCGSGYYQSLFGAFRVSDRHLARTTFEGASVKDWGYYTICDVREPGDYNSSILIDENRLYTSKKTTITPFSVDGAFTIRWFAVAGVAE